MSDMSRNEAVSAPTTTDQCPECGAAIPGGRTGCQALYDEINARAYGDLNYAAVQTLAFDTYCMQHLEPYCRSAKSYAAHLMRLCCGLEWDGDSKVYTAIQRWLNGTVALDKPAAPDQRGRMTIVDLQEAHTVEEYRRLVREWAQTVWESYAAQHDLAQRWIRAALRS
jgi:hypothetical protein